MRKATTAMTFCTSCAAPIATSSASCPSCGATLGQTLEIAANGAEPPRRHSRLLQLLYVAPVLVALSMGAGLLQRQSAQQQWLASAYATADSAAAAGDLVTARDGFTAIAGYRDASHRAEDLDGRLAPLEAAYLDGLQAMDRGDFAAAVALLAPVAAQAPGLEDVTRRLDDARGLLADSLQREVDGAMTIHDWSGAERTLHELVALDATNADARSRLATLQREHGPILLGKDRALWLVAPDASEARQLTDSVDVLWPVWSPDRSKIAFLASDPDDPMGNVALYTVDVAGSEPRRLVDGISQHAPPVWSPDGTKIAYTSFAGYDPVYESGSIGVRYFDLSTGKETDLTGDEFPLAFNPTWSPDGAEIAFIVKHQGLGERPQHSPGDVYIARLGAEGFTNLTDGSVRDVWSASWSPRGDSLLLFSLFGQTWYEPPSTSIRVIDRNSGDVHQIAGIEELPTSPVWSPDGSRFAFTINEKTLVIADSHNSRTSVELAEALSGELTWSPDGKALIMAPWDAGNSSTIVNLDGTAPTQEPVRFEFDANPPFISPPQWSSTAPVPPDANPSLPVPESSESPEA